MSGILSLLLDVIVLAGLGVTIFYCIRLSSSLNNFRQYRQEFNVLLQDLSQNIEKAQNAIAKLKDSSFEAGEDLQKVINNSRKLADELQLMNDMGNALANRLERVSEKGRGVANGKADFGDDVKTTKKAGSKPKPAFFIQDREFEDDLKDADEGFEDDLDDDMGDFQSKAEKELFDALKKNAEV